MIHRGEIPWGNGTLEYLEVTQMRGLLWLLGGIDGPFLCVFENPGRYCWMEGWVEGQVKPASSEIMGGSCSVLCDLGAYPSIPCHTLSLPWCVPTIPYHTWCVPTVCRPLCPPLVCAHRPSSRLMPPSSHRRPPPVAHRRELARTKLSPPHRAKIIQGPNSWSWKIYKK